MPSSSSSTCERLFAEVETWLDHPCIWSRLTPEPEAIDREEWPDSGRHLLRRVLPAKPGDRLVRARIEGAVNPQGRPALILGVWREEHLTSFFKAGESAKALMEAGQPVSLYYGRDSAEADAEPWKATLQLPLDRVEVPGRRLSEMIEDRPCLVEFMEAVMPHRVPAEGAWAGSRLLSAVPYLAVLRMLDQIRAHEGSGVQDGWSEIVYATLLGGHVPDDWWLGRGLAAALGHSRLPESAGFTQSVRLVLPDTLQDPEGRWCRAVALTQVNPEDCRRDLDFWSWRGLDDFGPVHLDWTEPALALWAYSEGPQGAYILAGKARLDLGSSPEAVYGWDLQEPAPVPLSDLISRQIVRLPPTGKVWRRQADSWAQYWRTLLRLALGARLAQGTHPEWLELGEQTRRERDGREGLWTPQWLGRRVPLECADGAPISIHPTGSVSPMLPPRMRYATGAWEATTRGLRWDRPQLKKTVGTREIVQHPRPRAKAKDSDQFELF
jgi:hypothetical protein